MGVKVNYNTETRQSISPGDMKVTMRIGGILYEIGHLFSYSLTTAVETVPLIVMGNKFPTASNRGKRSHQGVLIFNTINQSLVHELKTILRETKNPVINKKGSFLTKINSGTFIDTDFENELEDLVEVNNTEEINAMDLPEFDIILTAQDKRNPQRYSQKKIIGVTLYSQSSAIGIDTITTQDAYSFMCKSVTPLTSFFSTKEDINSAANENIAKEEDGYITSYF